MKGGFLEICALLSVNPLYFLHYLRLFHQLVNIQRSEIQLDREKDCSLLGQKVKKGWGFHWWCSHIIYHIDLCKCLWHGCWKYLLDSKHVWTDGETNWFLLKIFLFFFQSRTFFGKGLPVCRLERNNCIIIKVVFMSYWDSCSLGCEQARLTQNMNARHGTAHG